MSGSGKLLRRTCVDGWPALTAEGQSRATSARRFEMFASNSVVRVAVLYTACRRFDSFLAYFRLSGGIGRRKGLKTPGNYFPCRFKSCLS